jgi:hypothetical protein
MLNKFAFFFIAFIIAVQSCHAQQTQIQATITDPNGNPYSFLTGLASINCPGNQQPTYNGFTVPRNYPITGGDGNAHFTLVLYDVNVILPSGCSYNFSITAQDGVTSFIATAVGGSGSATPVTGTGPVNLSFPISAFAVPLPSSGGGTGNSTSGQSLVNLNNSVAGANTLAWTRVGPVLGSPFLGGGTISQQEPVAFVQAFPQVLSSVYSQVVGLLYTCNSFNICYAEAPHPQGPFTPYSGNPVIANSGCASNVLPISGQLVVFACNARVDIHRYHSTTHAISWVDDGAVVTHNAQPWYSAGADNSSILIVSNKCYLWFDGTAGSFQYSQGLFTGNSTCAVGSFTEQAGDPQIPFNTEFNGGGPFVFYDGVNFWQWELGGPTPTASNAYPSLLYFTKLNTNGAGTPAPHTHTQIMLPRFADEGGGNVIFDSQVADPIVLEWPFAQGDSRNTSYLFYSSCSNNCNSPIDQNFTISVAYIPLPMKNIVKIPQLDQGVQFSHTGWQFVNGISSNTPLPVPTMFDNANRPNNAGNMGGDWTALKSNSQAQIVSNQFQPLAVGSASRPLHARVQPNADQFSAVQLIAAASTSNIGAIVRGSPSVVSFYECVTQNALGVSQTIIIRKFVNGVGFTTVATQTGTPNSFDWMVFLIHGTALICTIYDSAGNIVVSGTDTTIQNGLPGLSLNDSVSTANAVVDNWSGGSIYGDGSSATQQTQFWAASQFFASPPISSGVGPTLTGTGACATGSITTQLGGAWGGSFKCTGTTGASTITLTFALTAPNGWNLTNAWDQTTVANSLHQNPGGSQTTLIIGAGTVTQNDVINWGAFPY